MQALVWEPTCQRTMSQRSFWWKGKGEEKETSGFGSKNWISFQAWTLHWAFQQMSKSLLAVDRQPNGPRNRVCGRAEEEEANTKDQHKEKMVYVPFLPRPMHARLKTKQARKLAKTLSRSALAVPVVYFPFLCSALLLRHGRNGSWIGVQRQPSLLSLTNMGGTWKCTKAWRMIVMSWRPPFGSYFHPCSVLTWEIQAGN